MKKKFLFQATTASPAKNFLRFPEENLQIKVSTPRYFESKHAFL